MSMCTVVFIYLFIYLLMFSSITNNNFNIINKDMCCVWENFNFKLKLNKTKINQINVVSYGLVVSIFIDSFGIII